MCISPKSFSWYKTKITEQISDIEQTLGNDFSLIVYTILKLINLYFLYFLYYLIYLLNCWIILYANFISLHNGLNQLFQNNLASGLNFHQIMDHTSTHLKNIQYIFHLYLDSTSGLSFCEETVITTVLPFNFILQN